MNAAGLRAPAAARAAARPLRFSSAPSTIGQAVPVSRRSSTRGRVAFLGARAADKDVEGKLSSVEGGTEETRRVLEQNATNVTKAAKLTAKAQKDLTFIAAKERQLADAENNLAMVESNLAKKEQELLEMLLMQKQSTMTTTDSISLMRRLEAAEAEAAALRAMVVTGRTEVTEIQTELDERPVVRSVWQWEDVEWEKLTFTEKISVWWDIVVGRTVDELRDEWAIAKANGFGLAGLRTLLLIGTVVTCVSYAILALAPAGSTEAGGVIAASLTRPFALPASTLQVMSRVVLSSLLVVVEHVCTLIYFIPTFVVVPAALGILLYRQRCIALGTSPFWDREGLSPKLGERREVYVKRMPILAINRQPNIYFRGAPIPKAVQNILNIRGPGIWPPRPIEIRKPATVSVDIGADVRSLLAGDADAAARANIPPLENTRLRSDSPPTKPAGSSDDFRTELLQSQLSTKTKQENLNVNVLNVVNQTNTSSRTVDLGLMAPRPEGNTFADVMKSFDAMRGVIEEAKNAEANGGRPPPPPQQ